MSQESILPDNTRIANRNTITKHIPVHYRIGSDSAVVVNCDFTDNLCARPNQNIITIDGPSWRLHESQQLNDRHRKQPA